MISIITTFYNEKENLLPLYEELKEALKDLDETYEVFFNDDGSTDGSSEVADELAKKDKHIRVFHQRKRSGKGEGLATGVRLTKGDILVFIDADLQDDPQDIPKLVKKLRDEKLDLVNGIRSSRHHNSFIKLYSDLGNRFVKFLAGSPFHDINCPVKAMRKEVFEDVTLYGNNFRFLPLAIYYKGYKVGEMPVVNRDRKHGVSKFGTGKVFVGLLDTITAYFLYKFSEKPLHFFGIIGGVVSFVGLILVIFYLFERIFFNVLLYRRPAFQLAMFLVIVGIQIVMTGFIGELLVYLHKKKN